MHKSILMMVLSFVSSSTMAAGDVKVLSCVGVWKTTGLPENDKELMSLYKDKEYSQTFELGDSTLLIKGGSVIPDAKLFICSKSASEYVFSSNCKVSNHQFLYDWNSEDDHTIYFQQGDYKHPSPFFRKYGTENSVTADLDELHIDRTTLEVEWTSYMPTTGVSREKHGYMMIGHTDMHCKVSKPKI